jgi:predicted nucleotidyltransferase
MTKIGLELGDIRGIVGPIAVRHGVNRVYLFGPRARGDNRADSDFDFCIDVPKSFDLMDIGGLMGDLKDALGGEVDLLCEDDMHEKPHLMKEVLRDRKIIFEV